jgi:large subunit ribosomal protein L18
LKHAIVQIIEAEAVGDRVVVSAHSRELAKTYGWLGNCGNVPSAYLTGFLCGFKAMANGVKKAFLDIGLHFPSKGTRIFAALKGVIDAGIEVPHGEAVFSDENRITGKHIADYASYLSSEPEVYNQKFSEYFSKGLQPKEMSEHFSVVKDRVKSSFEKKVKERKEEI